MAWIGFIALIVFGAWVFLGGIVLLFMKKAFSGNTDGEGRTGIIIAIIGAAILYAAWLNRPFERLFV